MPSSAPPRNPSYRPCRGRPAGRRGDVHPPVRRRGRASRGRARAGRRGGDADARHRPDRAPVAADGRHAGGAVHREPRPRDAPHRLPRRRHPRLAARGRRGRGRADRHGAAGRPVRARGGVHPSRQRRRGARRVRPIWRRRPWLLT